MKDKKRWKSGGRPRRAMGSMRSSRRKAQRPVVRSRRARKVGEKIGAGS